jgi:hypothetical protein
MNDLATGTILPGSAVIVAGLALMLFPKVSSPGRFPGDLLINREHAAFSFPLATSIVVSILISLILSLIGRFRWVPAWNWPAGPCRYHR